MTKMRRGSGWRRAKRALPLAYLAVLAASTFWRIVFPWQPAARGEQQTIKRETPGGSVEIRYWDTALLAGSGKPVILMLHGSSASSRTFDPLRARLGSDYRLIVPDLPGFGRSTPRLSDLSARRLADDASWLMESLGIETFHLAARGTGGGIAIRLLEAKSASIKSVTLISSLGPQEYDLLGDHTLNHALHRAQLLVFWLVDWLVPHFGLLDRGLFDRSYARAAFDTDQRSFAAILAKAEQPALILQGGQDAIVPRETARELARLMPQARLIEYPSVGHRLIEREGDKVAGAMRGFLEWVEAGLEAGRQGRVPAGEPIPLHRSGWLVAALLAVATFASEDLACIGGGLLASQGTLPLSLAIGGCLLGIFVGDFTIYLIGRFLGTRALSLPGIRRFASPARVARCSRWFEKKGPVLIISTRFVPGSRVLTYFSAGMVKLGVVRFSAALLLGTALWTPIIVGFSYYLGGAFLAYFKRFEGWALLAVLASLAMAFLLARLAIGLFTWRGRRLLYSRYRRLTRWEYWPIWALYPPVCLYIGWLSCKRRSITAVTATNPCMPASGLVFESKGEILEHLQKHGVPVARFGTLPAGGDPETRTQLLQSFLKRIGSGFPVALKPDVGQRGEGVAIAKDEGEARSYFAQSEQALIMQEFIPGREYGVFYIRRPDSPAGFIFSVTDKRFTSVMGDGQSTLEQLILADARAVAMAPYFLSKFEPSLDVVVPEGESFVLTELGTHSKGALFLDGQTLITEALTRSVDSFSRDVDGFFFGRYDVRVPTEEALKSGQGLKVIELNGLTSESTNIYDPNHGLGFAYRTLLRQWKLAFEIGQANARAGEKTIKKREALRLLRRHLFG